ncbi:hypothetical protein GX865_00370 [Candidatus Saccharibacteria bacterium]|jgi:hypothetical protein|nr:hypothetical protein [Candidatus Saccharibacteria bacterium]
MFANYRKQSYFFLVDVNTVDIRMTLAPTWIQGYARAVKAVSITIAVISLAGVVFGIAAYEAFNNTAMMTLGVSLLTLIFLATTMGKAIKRENYFTQDDPAMKALEGDELFKSLIEQEGVKKWLYGRLADQDEHEKLIASTLQNLAFEYFLESKRLNKRAKLGNNAALKALEVGVKRTAGSMSHAVEKQRLLEQSLEQESIASKEAKERFRREEQHRKLEGDLERAKLNLRQAGDGS